jgi:hypothetical protein
VCPSCPGQAEDTHRSVYFHVREQSRVVLLAPQPPTMLCSHGSVTEHSEPRMEMSSVLLTSPSLCSHLTGKGLDWMPTGPPPLEAGLLWEACGSFPSQRPPGALATWDGDSTKKQKPHGDQRDTPTSPTLSFLLFCCLSFLVALGFEFRASHLPERWCSIT